MANAIPVHLDAHFGVDPPAADGAPALSPAAVPGDIRLAAYEDLSAIERDWRAFEAHADGTVFQCFDWLAAWQRHIGVRTGVRPAIVVGSDPAGAILFLLPLSVHSAGVMRELTWLGSDLCDYNAPLLAPAFAERFDRARFLSLWANITQCLQSNPRLQYDCINLTKMPEMVGAQPNPMLALRVTVTPSGAYLAHLAGDWKTFYEGKRSSTNRRRDRTKRRKLADHGEVRLINPESDSEILRTVDTLMEQKARSLARMGVGNLFARPGHAEFFRAVATDPAYRHLVHVSRLDVGTTAAAVNLGLTYRNCYYHLLASYDDGELSRFGPGVVHLHELLHQTLDRGFHVFDFTIGDERYKHDWCDTELKLYDHISAATWRGALVAMPMLAIRRLKRWIKQTPALWKVASFGRSLIGSVALRFRR